MPPELSDAESILRVSHSGAGPSQEISGFFSTSRCRRPACEFFGSIQRRPKDFQPTAPTFELTTKCHIRTSNSPRKPAMKKTTVFCRGGGVGAPDWRAAGRRRVCGVHRPAPEARRLRRLAGRDRSSPLWRLAISLNKPSYAEVGGKLCL
jgi:hypothetical protein